jgi:hypothetical protein
MEGEASAGEHGEEDSGDPGGEKLAGEGVGCGEDEGLGVELGFAIAELRPEESGPEPGYEDEVSCDVERGEEAGKEEACGDGVPPPALAAEEEAEFGENQGEEAVVGGAVGDCGGCADLLKFVAESLGRLFWGEQGCRSLRSGRMKRGLRSR